MAYYVYIHTNLINGKVYIGASQNPESRWGKDGEGYKNNAQFWTDIQKYNWNSGFSHKKHEVFSIEEMSIEEARLVELFDATNPEKGYNHREGGLSGWHHSDTWKEDHSADMEQWWDSHPEAKTAQREAQKQYRIDHPDYQKGENAPMYGKTQSLETRKKIKDSNSGQTRTLETRKNIAKATSISRKDKHRAIGPDGKVHMYTQEEIDTQGLQHAPSYSSKGKKQRSSK